MGQDRADERQVNGECCRSGAFLGALAAKLDETTAVERRQFDAAEFYLEGGKNGGLGPAWGPADLLHVLLMQIDEVPECPQVQPSARTGASAPVDVALDLKCPFLAVLAATEGLGHVASLAADLDAPVS
ncbi:hypothetical protein JQ557_25895 [Bradyrhizobium sp. U87765 SZCCT0131]|uniref:hypothetical protein n=1 Tax=unclassified Bradyrhizobium TaxID=2631580 RepID=UPI001BAB5706|nr:MULTISPECIES: hypothetical protein [unclassified Bradyrhizobium]MBR1221459.1 hypothetical protein [Bradyrhizobium sp. U87765 SZCCT0131]MBR1264618.1 hypothetical protein [Bradyrhizobium sp. U87765 SZCCT0134]MBR1304476.1 hypothetical protein [Bradyrhizobium sp. U87765 SZCCT0110]MBR1346405.1 hypothetical protein [Bradyrhizobium sp. U87765 SZCCT0048]